MTINTGINPSLLRPQTFHVLTYLLGGRTLVPIPQRMLLIGMQSTAAMATAQVIIPVNDPGEIDNLFGMGSFLALMARKAIETMNTLGSGPALFACPLADTTTARVELLTITGPATADGTLVFRIAGRYINVPVKNGDSATTIAAAARDAINALKQILPLTASAAAGVVTMTFVCKGVLGNDCVFSNVTTPAGLTAVFSQSVAGAGVLDIQPALDAAAGQEFDVIAICNHASADITEINTHIATTWSASEKKPRWFFIGEPGSISTATTLASAANHEGVEIINAEQSPSLPCEMAAAGGAAALSISRPNGNFDGMKIPIYPPPISFDFTTGEVETALGSGITALKSIVDVATKNVVEGVMYITRLVTSRTTTLQGGSQVPFGLLRDFGVSRTAWFMARQYDLLFAARFGASANPDGVLDDDDSQKKIRDLVTDANYAAQDQKILKNVDSDKAKLVVEDDPVTSGRVNVDVAYTIIVGLHQVAFVHRAQVGG